MDGPGPSIGVSVPHGDFQQVLLKFGYVENIFHMEDAGQ